MKSQQQHRIGPETDRLQHRAFTVDDAEAFFAINSHPIVMRYTGEPILESLSAAGAAIAAYPDFETVGFGRWACVLKATRTVIGFCGLKYLPDLEVVDVGYRFLPRYWDVDSQPRPALQVWISASRFLVWAKIVGLVLPEKLGINSRA